LITQTSADGQQRHQDTVARKPAGRHQKRKHPATAPLQISAFRRDWSRGV